MASDTRGDDAATRSVRRAVGQLVSALTRAVFGVCAVVVGTLALLLAVGTNTGDSGTVFVILGIAAILVGVTTISRLPKPNSESAADTLEQSTDSTDDPTQDRN
jgi:membrane protein implicated in regulation of membrane protease activity